MKLSDFIEKCPRGHIVKVSYMFSDKKNNWKRLKLTIKPGATTQFSTDMCGAYYQLTEKSAIWQWQFYKDEDINDIFGNRMISLSATYEGNGHEKDDFD